MSCAGHWADGEADEFVRQLRVHPPVRCGHGLPQRHGCGIHPAAALRVVGGLPGEGTRAAQVRGGAQARANHGKRCVWTCQGIKDVS